MPDLKLLSPISIKSGGSKTKKVAKKKVVAKKPIMKKGGMSCSCDGKGCMKCGGKHYKKGGTHRGFKAVQADIAKKQGISMEAAGAILASSARKASPKSKKANPRLLNVKGKAKK